jgi:hypothetical protein
VFGRRDGICVGEGDGRHHLVEHGVQGLRKPVAAVQRGRDDTSQLQHGDGEQGHVHGLVIGTLDGGAQLPSPR